MYTYTHTYTKHFFMPLENFILIKESRETIIAQKGGPALCAARVLPLTNKQLPACLAITIAG